MKPVVQRQPTQDIKEDTLQQNRVESMTLTQFIVEGTKGDRQMALLMNTIQHACKVCANAIKKAGPCDLYGLAGQQNSTGDDVKKLDVISNVVWVDCLKASGVCCLLVSEEEEEPIIINEGTTGPFC